MTAEIKGVFSLKVRSNSMQIVRIVPKSPQFQKLKKSRQKIQQQLQHGPSQNRQILDIKSIKNQELQEIDAKMKAIPERSLKKLEERYETIDKWKQKYVPESSIVLIRNKLNAEDPSFKGNSIEKSAQVSQTLGQSAKNQLLPTLIKRQQNPSILEHEEQGRKLEELLRQRLEKNKKYYELKNLIVEKQIKYLQDINTFVTTQKKREFQLRKPLIKLDNKEGFSRENFYQKVSISQTKISKQGRTLKAKFQKSQKDRYKLNDDTQLVNKKGQTDIFQLKAKLMDQVVGTTPQGWDTLDLAYSPEQQDL